MQGLEELDKTRNSLKLWASIPNDTIHLLVKLKSKIGYAGVVKFLSDELNPSPLRYSCTPEHMMRLINVAEKFIQLGLSRKITDPIPLVTWLPIMRYVSKENAKGILEFLYSGGTLNTLKENFSKGLKMEYNEFSRQFEFSRESSNADIESPHI